MHLAALCVFRLVKEEREAQMCTQRSPRLRQSRLFHLGSNRDTHTPEAFGQGCKREGGFYKFLEILVDKEGSECVMTQWTMNMEEVVSI